MVVVCCLSDWYLHVLHVSVSSDCFVFVCRLGFYVFYTFWINLSALFLSVGLVFTCFTRFGLFRVLCFCRSAWFLHVLFVLDSLDSFVFACRLGFVYVLHVLEYSKCFVFVCRLGFYMFYTFGILSALFLSVGLVFVCFTHLGS